MPALGVSGDRGEWLDLGQAFQALASQLDGEFSGTSTAVQAMASTWYGPAATTFAGTWAARRPCYQDMIEQVHLIAQAVTRYGNALADMAARAANLESVWCGAGLHLLATGEGFMLPPGMESLPATQQVSLRQALSSSVTDVEYLGEDLAAAVGDLAAVLGPAITFFEDVVFAELGILRGAVDEFLAENKGPVALAGDLLGVVARAAEDAAPADGKVAAQLREYAATAGTTAEREAASGIADLLEQRQVSEVGLAKKLPMIGAAVGVVTAGIEVVQGARNVGYRSSLEDHAGHIASATVGVAGSGLLGDAPVGAVGSALIDSAGTAVLGAAPEVAVGAEVLAAAPEIAVGAGVLAAAPEIAVGVGVVVAGGVVAAGVGYAVQGIVDHRKAIGHFVENVL